jgi:uncharacterized membrane-anchored protein YhcB (DUF1043 family)
MDTKNIAIGLVVGVLIGALGIYAVDMSRFDQLNKQIKSLDDQITSLQHIIDTQEEAVAMVDALALEVNTSRVLIKQYEEYKKTAEELIAKLTDDSNKLNYLYAAQTYRAEEALTVLNTYDENYEPGTDFYWVYGNLSFQDWWEINGGPFEEWTRLVYP